MVLTRELLYGQVWAEPVSKVAARYGVSNVTLAKICKRLQVPTPDRSYWTQRAAGRSPVKPALAPARPGMVTEYELPIRLDAGVDNGAVRATIAADPSVTHPLAVELENILANSLAQEQGRVRPANDVACLDVAVTAGTARRAARVMNALIRVLEARGHRVELGPVIKKQFARHYDEIGSTTKIMVGDVPVKFRLEEIIDWTPTDEQKPGNGVTYRNGKFCRVGPTGRLSLMIDTHGTQSHRRVWSDRAAKKVEDYFGEFIAIVELIAGERRAFDDQFERERIARQREGYKEALVQKLWERSHVWNAAVATLSYLDAAARHYATGEPDSEIEQMLAFARQQAELDAADALDLRPMKFVPAPTRS